MFLYGVCGRDGSGSLDCEELKKLMYSVSQGDVQAFPAGDPMQTQAACIAYKLKCLEDLLAKGIIDDHTLREKRRRIHHRHHELMTPRLRDREPEPEEVDFVLDRVDSDHDGRIGRNECLAALGLWMHILKEDPFHVNHGVKDKSHACPLM